MGDAEKEPGRSSDLRLRVYVGVGRGELTGWWRFVRTLKY